MRYRVTVKFELEADNGSDAKAIVADSLGWRQDQQQLNELLSARRGSVRILSAQQITESKSGTK